jgi:hypothetical protein
MKKLFAIFLSCAAIVAISSCKKSPDYVPVPFACACGTFEWQGANYDLLGANYILSDSLEPESRRYYITANVALEGEVQTHELSAWIQIDSLDGGGQFRINPQTGDNEFTAWVDEFNLNDPLDTLRQYVPVNAVVAVTEAPLSGGTESVSFQMTLNEVIDGAVVPGDVNCTGTFSLYINQ